MLLNTDALIFPAAPITHRPLKNRRTTATQGQPPHWAKLTCRIAGTSATFDPTIQCRALGQLILDGTIEWQITSITESATPTPWLPTHAYTLGATCTSTVPLPPRKLTSTLARFPKRLAPGPGPDTDPFAYASIPWAFWWAGPIPVTPALLRRQWLGWCANHWLANPEMHDAGYNQAAAAIEIINWKGEVKTPTPYDLYMAQSGIQLAASIPVWAEGPGYPYLSTYDGYVDWGSPFPPPIKPDQPYWPAPVISGASAVAPDRIAATVTDLSGSVTPAELFPLLVGLYATPPLLERCLTAAQHLYLVAGGWISPTSYTPPPPTPNYLPMLSGNWGGQVPLEEYPPTVLPSPLFRLKAGDKILIAARTLRYLGNLSAWATQWLSVG